jgi:hypothetical protein
LLLAEVREEHLFTPYFNSLKLLDSILVRLSFITLFVVLYFILDVFELLYVAGGVAILLFAIPPLGNAFAKVWLKITQAIGHFNAVVLLTLIYFIVVTPMGLLQRLFGKDELTVKRKERSTLFFERNHSYTKEDLDKIW